MEMRAGGTYRMVKYDGSDYVNNEPFTVTEWPGCPGYFEGGGWMISRDGDVPPVGRVVEHCSTPVSDDPRPVSAWDVHATLCVGGKIIDIGSGVPADELSIEPATLGPESEVITDKPPAHPLWHDEPGELDRLRRYFATQWRSDDFA